MALMQPILNQRLTRVIALWLILGTVSAAAEAADELVFANGFEFDGEFDFVMPYLGPPTPAEGRLESNGTFKSVDLYLLEDVSGSMGTEITSVSAGFTGLITQISCGPGEEPAVNFCIPNLETGVGEFGRSAIEPWTHLKDINPDHSATQGLLPTTTSGGGLEQHIGAMHMTTSGVCAAAPQRAGKACFRPDSLRIIALFSDEDFHEDDSWGTVTEQLYYEDMAALGIRVLGITGTDSYGEVSGLRTDLLNMRAGDGNKDLVPSLTSIPATDPCFALTAGAAAFHNSRAIVSGPDAEASDALTCGLQGIVAFLPHDLTMTIVNSPSNIDYLGNPVDAVAAFVDHIEVFEDGSAECSSGNNVVDTDGDGLPDQFVFVLPGTPVCWKLFVRQNQTIEGAPVTRQLFTAMIEVRGEGGALLDSRRAAFLVPPNPEP